MIDEIVRFRAELDDGRVAVNEIVQDVVGGHVGERGVGGRIFRGQGEAAVIEAVHRVQGVFETSVVVREQEFVMHHLGKREPSGRHGWSHTNTAG